MSRPIFLSYRRSDSGDASLRLYEGIRTRFGAESIYMDTASTAWGEEWPKALENAISTADVVIVVIGPAGSPHRVTGEGAGSISPTTGCGERSNSRSGPASRRCRSCGPGRRRAHAATGGTATGDRGAGVPAGAPAPRRGLATARRSLAHATGIAHVGRAPRRGCVARRTTGRYERARAIPGPRLAVL
jgi:hypothetical protein